MAADPELAANLAAVAHLIHGSTEGRFTVTYAPGPELSRADIEGVGFRYLALDEALERFPPRRRSTSRTRGSGCGGSEGRPLHRGVRGSASTCTASVADLPIVSPHGHIDVRLLADPAARLDPPGRLFVTADHYVVRMLYSQGVPLERAGLASGGEAEVDDRAVWQLLADNVHLFALTPTGLWLRETLATVFGIEERLDPASAETIYARVEEQLATPAFAPRALLDRFRVECLSTTDAAGSSLAEHRALADSQPGFRIRPTFRPDAVVALDAAGWRDALVRARGRRRPRGRRLRDVRRGARRAARRVQGARRDGDRSRGDERRHDAACRQREASALFAAALAGSVSARRRATFRGAHAERVRADELRRRARDAAPRRQPARPQRPARRAVRARHRRRHPGRDRLDARPAARCSRRAATIPASPSFSSRSTRAPTAASSRRSRATIPRSCSAAHGGSTTARAGIDRFLDRVTETAGLYNLAGFVDDARALTALPARHDLWRRRTCGWLARKVDGRLPRRGRGPSPRVGARLRPRAPRVPARLDAAERVEAAVDRHDDAGDERRGSAAQPDHGAGELVRLAEAPAGVAATIRSPRAVNAPDSSSRSARFCSPTKKPGATAFTRTPRGASSTASHRVRFSTAAFAAP